MQGRIFLFVSMLTAMVFVLLGCTGNRFVLGDLQPPRISDVQVNPTSLRFFGGQVTISAQVEDPSRVDKVWAEVQRPSGEKVEVEMHPMVRSSIYQGTFEANPNTRNDGQAEIYKVWVRAKDGKGNETPAPGEPETGITLTVPAPIPPPERPDL